MANVEKLLYAIDPRTNATLFAFAKGTKLSEPINRPAALIQLPGVGYGYNARGAYPNPVGDTQIAWEFLWPWDATWPDWSTLRAALDLAIGGGRQIVLQKADAAGAVYNADAFCTSIPGEEDPEARFLGKFSLTFQQLGKWAKPYPSGFSLYDTGLLYDAGNLYDNQTGTQFTLAAASLAFTVSYGGTADEDEANLFFQGPIAGPFILYNLNSDPFGNWFPWSAANPNPNPLYVVVSDTIGGGAASTTLAASTAAGANIFQVASTTGIIPGDTLVLDSGANLEYVTVAAVSAPFVAPDPSKPLAKAHANGVAAVKQTDVYALNGRTGAVSTTKPGVAAYANVARAKGQRSLFLVKADASGRPTINNLFLVQQTAATYGGKVTILAKDRFH